MSQCPIPGCTASAQPGELLCTPHWRQVPEDLKKQVWRTWSWFVHARTVQKRTAALGPYREARKAAIDAVTKVESLLV